MDSNDGFDFASSWISKLLKKTAKQQTLHLDDLYDLLPHLESKALTDRLEGHWLDEVKQTDRPPSLVRATVKTLGWSPVLYGLLLIPNVSAMEVRDENVIDLCFSPLSGTHQIVTTDPTHFSHGFLRSLSNHLSVDSLATGDYHWYSSTDLQRNLSQGTDELHRPDVNGMSDRCLLFSPVFLSYEHHRITDACCLQWPDLSQSKRLSVVSEAFTKEVHWRLDPSTVQSLDEHFQLGEDH